MSNSINLDCLEKFIDRYDTNLDFIEKSIKSGTYRTDDIRAIGLIYLMGIWKNANKEEKKHINEAAIVYTQLLK